MGIMLRRSIRLLAAALLIAGVAQAARAADNCVVVVGTDSSGPHITMDPAFINTDDDAYHQYAVYNRLIRVDEKMQLQPELASSWEVSKDGLTWTFDLVKGVTFHDGRPFTAKDVVYTFKAHRSGNRLRQLPRHSPSSIRTASRRSTTPR